MTQDKYKTKSQLVDELVALRKRHAEREGGEEALHFKERVIESASSAIAICDLEGNMTYGNPSFVELWGFDNPKEFIGKPFWKYWLLEGRLEEIMQALRADGIWADEVQAVRTDGTHFEAQVSAAVVVDQKGNPIALTSTSTDITERKQADEALRLSEQRYRSVSEAASAYSYSLAVAPDGSVEVDWVGGEFTKVTGYDVETIEDLEKWLAIINAQDIPKIRKQTAQVLAGEPSVLEYRITDRSGQEHWLHDASSPVVDEATGRVVAIRGAVRDITDQKQAEEAMRESEERFRSLSESSPIGVFQTDDKGAVLYTNPRWRSITGLTLDESLGFGWSEALHPDDIDRVLGDWAGCLREEKGYAGEFRFLSSSGDVKWVYTCTAPVRSPRGEVIGHVGTNEDITERKHAEAALRKSEQHLSTVSRIAQILLTVPDDEMYGEVLETVLGITGSRYGIFGYIDEDGALVCPSMTRDVWAQCEMAEKSIRFPSEQWCGIWGRALTEKKTLYSNSPGTVPDGHVPISRTVVVPIQHHDEVIGEFMVANKSTDYTHEDVQALENIAGYVAPVLDARSLRSGCVKHRRWKQLARWPVASLMTSTTFSRRSLGSVNLPRRILQKTVLHTAASSRSRLQASVQLSW
jgi:PAS domain S-box-containing protein